LKHFAIRGIMVESEDGRSTIHIDSKIETPESFDIPDWMTPAQTEAIEKLYMCNPDGSKSRKEFYDRVAHCGRDYCGLRWCSMFLGIEKDGYTHS